ncbi:MAG: alkane 1-monooxygenase [Gammaproteobacteria bacterium]|nr:alkane 1-monooxygenase [Gammaproteobacteria bacterium]MDH5213808.1 alkane 1-monooxygenase [Gammaproteobacteria bacterium]
MKSFSTALPSGELIDYVDGKRWLWMLSVVYPLQPFAGIWLHAQTGYEAWLLLPLAFAYLLGPALDYLFGEDRQNPPEAIVPQLDQDPYYRYLTYAVVPLHFVSLVGAAWWAGSQGLSIWAFVGLAAVAGMTSGLGINTGHELGHKKSRLERNLAKLVLAVPAYGHFSIEHNLGHHRDVATPEDPASSRMGESIYRFALREVPGAFRRAWAIEKERLGRNGKSAWNVDNEILQSLTLTAILQLGLVVALGWSMIFFLLIHNVFAWWQLTSANYIEHYGLLRSKDENGRYERCQPLHSWNSNHVYSNLVLFHLERHSDHHAHPMRRYQSLRHFDDLPSLPSGYFGSYLLAYIPSLWYRVMDKRLLSLKQVSGDLSRINIDPKKRDTIYTKYGYSQQQVS